MIHDQADVLVGYLVTHPDGFEARLSPDRTRAELYAARNRATIEPMFVRRTTALVKQICTAANGVCPNADSA